MKPQSKPSKSVRNPEFIPGGIKKNLGPGKSHADYYKGGNPSRGQSTPRKVGELHQDHTMEQVIDLPSTLDYSRYEQAKDPLRHALGIHASTKISPMMAQKYVGHSNPKVAAQARKIAKGYHSSIGSNTQGPNAADSGR